METYQTINHTKDLKTGSPAKKILSILSWYPFIWTVGILVYGLIKSHFLTASHFLIVGILSTWVIFIYVGALTWLGLLIYLPLKKKITIKQTILYVLILSLGAMAAYYVFEYDIFGSGVKYID